MAQSSVQVLRAADRFLTEREAISTTHGLSFGDHYDPARTSFGRLVAHNVETLQAGAGYPPHLHRDVEIVTWVVSGSLEHSDDHGHSAVLGPRTVQRLSAAGGVTHSEVNPAGPGGSTTQFVQMWLSRTREEFDPDPDQRPSYERGVVDPAALWAGWVALASNDADLGAVVSLHEPGVTLWAAQIGARTSRQLPSGDLVHLFVVAGSVAVSNGDVLSTQDTAMLRQAGRLGIRADDDAQVLALTMPR